MPGVEDENSVKRKYAVVYNPQDHKLKEDNYSYTYLGMLRAVVRHFSPQLVCQNCSIKDIDADVILFYDPHSSHHIQIDGIAESSALKIEFINDPHQAEYCGRYRNGDYVHKLGREQRKQRLTDRKIDYVWCPYQDGFKKYFGDFPLLWFPIALQADLFSAGSTPLSERRPEVLANGATNDSMYGCYAFRRWAFQRPGVSLVGHAMDGGNHKGKQYGQWLAQYAGGLALTEFYPIPKHLEMPLAGCVTFMQYLPELEEIGFRHNENCLFVTMQNFDEAIADFKRNPLRYQHMASAGRSLVINNYTTEHLARFLENKINGLFS